MSLQMLQMSSSHCDACMSCVGVVVAVLEGQVSREDELH